jgi:hypothetical protein
MTKVQERQRFIRYYKEQTGQKEVNMHDVARFAEKMGWRLPKPPSGIDILAKQFAQAANEEIGYDKKTKRPYRANLAITQRMPSGEQLAIWIETDGTPRHKMVKALTQYREQMVGEAVMASDTADHWNRVNPAQQPILFQTDFTDDVEWRRNAPDEGEKAS